MPIGYRQAQNVLESLLRHGSRAELMQRLEPRTGVASRQRMRSAALTLTALEQRWDALSSPLEVRAALADPHTVAQM